MDPITIVLLIVVLIIIFFASKVDIMLMGKQAKGRISYVDHQTNTDHYGNSRVTYLIRYNFTDKNGYSYSGEMSINNYYQSSVPKVGTQVKVYYLPNQPERNCAELE